LIGENAIMKEYWMCGDVTWRSIVRETSSAKMEEMEGIATKAEKSIGLIWSNGYPERGMKLMKDALECLEL
jgi:hypothetical protein